MDLLLFFLAISMNKESVELSTVYRKSPLLQHVRYNRNPHHRISPCQNAVYNETLLSNDRRIIHYRVHSYMLCVPKNHDAFSYLLRPCPEIHFQLSALIDRQSAEGRYNRFG